MSDDGKTTATAKKKTYSSLQALLAEMRKEGKRISPPEPNVVDSKIVNDCLALEEEGDGILFGYLLQDKLLYTPSSDRWYVWQGNVWRPDNINIVPGLVRYLTDRYGEEIAVVGEELAGLAEDDPSAKWLKIKRAKLQAKIKSLRKDAGRTAAIKFARTYFNNPFVIEGDEFDKNPWLLGVPNGVVDLRTGQLLNGIPSQLVSKQCDCPYEPDTDQTEFKQFLADIYDNDQELIDFIQTLFGYGITGDTSQHVFPFFLGKGRNGKSLLINAIMRVMGDYAAVIPCELFLKNNMPKSASQADPAIMKLEGLRLAISSEVEEGSHFSAKSVKQITGGDVLEGRNPYDKNIRNFEPTHLAMMIGNHEPNPPSGDPAFWDRTYLINHPIRFVHHEPETENERPADPFIESKLKGMGKQILCWLIDGALLWQANDHKLHPPASVLKATEDYKEDSDWVAQFLEECCILNKDATTGSTELYVAFSLWYQETINNRKNQVPTQRAWGLKLKKRDGIATVRKAVGVYYQGLMLNSQWQTRMMDTAKNGGES